MLTLYKGLFRLCMKYSTHMSEWFHSQGFTRSDGIKTSSSYQLLSSHWLSGISFSLLECGISYCFVSPFSCQLLCQILKTSCLLPWPLIPILSTSVMHQSQSFVPFYGKLWNCLPASLFPSSYDLTSIKRKVSIHFFGLLSDMERDWQLSDKFFTLLPLACFPLFHKKRNMDTARLVTQSLPAS